MARCLIVDDSKIIRLVARKVLQEFGFDADEAGSGLEALEQCAGEMPDAVLLDWSLPGEDAFEVLKQLRSLPGAERTVILFCTTKTDQAHLQEALDAGANELISKPFDGEILHQKLSSAGLL